MADPDPLQPYGRFAAEHLILRDHLALDRTVLANERTLLAYWRTALTLVIAGLTFVHFLSGSLLGVIGWLFIPAGLLPAALGWLRYRRLRRLLAHLTAAADEPRG